MAIKLKSEWLKSFRVEIIIYTMLSILYALLTEGTVYLLLGIIRKFINRDTAIVGKVEIDSAAIADLESGRQPVGLGNSIEGIESSAGIKQEFTVFWIAMFVIIGIVLFIFYFFLLTKKFSVYLNEILCGINEVAMGNFNSKITVQGENEFAQIANQFNQMADDIKNIMEGERKTEKAKNDLITNVAHDLRTPLTSILGYLDLALGSKEQMKVDEETKDKYISISYQKAKRLEKLIEDLFNYTKFSSGEVILRKRELDLVKFMEQMLEEFYPSFQENQLECIYENFMEEAVIWGDGELLARAIANLMSNAVKYGKDGKKIVIKIFREDEQVKLSITNYGEIISEKDIEHVFDKFFRGESSRSRETGGTGLGLAITQRIIFMHEGMIEVHSDIDGTVFQIAIPLYHAESSEE